MTQQRQRHGQAAQHGGLFKCWALTLNRGVLVQQEVMMDSDCVLEFLKNLSWRRLYRKRCKLRYAFRQCVSKHREMETNFGTSCPCQACLGLRNLPAECNSKHNLQLEEEYQYLYVLV